MALKNNKGFTLLELIMALAISSILLTALFSFLIFNVNVYHRTDEEMRLKNSLDEALTRITEMAKGAYGIEYSESDRISFLNKSGEESGAITFDNEQFELTISYDVESNAIYDNIEDFELTNTLESDGLIEITIKGRSERASKTVSTTVRLRNYDSQEGDS